MGMHRVKLCNKSWFVAEYFIVRALFGGRETVVTKTRKIPPCKKVYFYARGKVLRLYSKRGIICLIIRWINPDSDTRCSYHPGLRLNSAGLPPASYGCRFLPVSRGTRRSAKRGSRGFSVGYGRTRYAGCRPPLLPPG